MLYEVITQMISVFEKLPESIHYKDLVITSYSIHYTKLYEEACPGPQDSDYLFDRFIEMMEVTKNA